MEIKSGAHNYSSVPQDLGVRTERIQNAPSEEWKKAYGDQSLGDVLNQVADPKWIDPKKAIRHTGKAELGKDDFLKLMLTQMKHQDPLNPMDSQQMATQLAQFTSLEQLVNMNETLKDIKTNSKDQFQVLALIGKSVSGDSSRITRADEKEQHQLNFFLGQDAVQATVKIKDENGKVVRSYDYKGLKKGDHQIDWSGETEEGLQARAGEYKLSVEAKDSQGKSIVVKTDFEGKITGVNYTPSGPILLVGKQSVRLSDVKKIIDPELEKGPSEKTEPNQVIPKAENVKETESHTPRKGNLKDVGMAQGLINKLEKEKVLNE